MQRNPGANAGPFEFKANISAGFLFCRFNGCFYDLFYSAVKRNSVTVLNSFSGST